MSAKDIFNKELSPKIYKERKKYIYKELFKSQQ